MPGPPFPPTIYVLGTAQDSGKTVACLGIIAKLLSSAYGLAPREVGYMKPVGQHAVQVLTPDGPWVAERDAVLVTSLMGLECPGYHLVSPVIWYPGRTERCIARACRYDPTQIRDRLLRRIVTAYGCVAQGRRAVVVEGTGQMGVGSVAGISAANVIAALAAQGVPVTVLMVARGDPGTGGTGYGTVDQVEPHLLALQHLGVSLDGLLVNRVATPQIDAVASGLQAFYRRVFPRLVPSGGGSDLVPEIAGLVPEIPELALPSMRLLNEHFQHLPGSAAVVLVPPTGAERASLVRRPVVLSLDRDYEPLLRDGDLVVVGANANARIVSVLEHHAQALQRGAPGLAGLILSCMGIQGLLPRVRDMVIAADLPTLMVDLDSAEVVQALGRLRVKVQPYDVIKRDLIAAAYCRHLGPLPGMGALDRPGGLVSLDPRISTAV